MRAIALIIAAATLASACVDRAFKVAEVEGSRYCVPKKYIPPSLFGISREEPEPLREVAFYIGDADLQKRLKGAPATTTLHGVFSAAREDVYSEGGPAPGSHYYDHIRRTETEKSVRANGNLLFVYEYSDKQTFQVWARKSGNLPQSPVSPITESYPKLLGSCSRATSKADNQSSPPVHTCSRSAHLAIGTAAYTVHGLSEDSISRLAEFDRIVQVLLTEWRCNAA